MLRYLGVLKFKVFYRPAVRNLFLDNGSFHLSLISEFWKETVCAPSTFENLFGFSLDKDEDREIYTCK